MNWTGTSEELSDTNVLSHSEFYNDFLLPNLNIRHAMFGVVEKGKSRIANISVFRRLQRDDSNRRNWNCCSSWFRI